MLASLLLVGCLAGSAWSQQPIAATPVALPVHASPVASPAPAPAALELLPPPPSQEKGVPSGIPQWLDPAVVRVMQLPARAAAAPPIGPAAKADESPTAYRIPFDLPGPERLFRLDSEEALFQRMMQEARERKPEALVFPEQPVLAKEPYRGRDWPRTRMVVEPHYVCHGRLHFEQLNAERYGWDLGFFQPFVSLACFYKDVVLLPYHTFTDPCRCYDCNAGKCLPGDPVPLLLYPPELSLTGILAEGATIAGLAAIFP